MSTDHQESVRELDVRDVEGEPFEQIMNALDAVSESEALRLVNSFEPVPLYDVLSKKGYQYDTEQVADEEWHVTIRPE
ncbi:DUF2249 domain-containing protein [Haloarcula sp. CBA1130]|uniref:DUF2249 domain-containing protein n=1 Tax=unclassified Haloarcula TaxID=2624677 RepID=UPI0012476ABD|nr:MULTISPECIES: DUF2249 domain-containing protein [unclassified Haloarcula]KAA9398784.1 DUF2249 domain-containing protein [Haloarcula sp. CBA1129]KAA9403299.1 DUF2249 domain-containing protein [Haloarcula sp. CBA1130]